MSDHFSGPGVLGDPAVDLTDLYAFVSPDRPGRLTVVLNVFPRATPESLFSDAADYRVLIRALSPDLTARDAELSISARFDVPADGPQHCRIATSTGETVSLTTGTTAGSERLQAFAGLRADPFFMDALAALRSEQEGRLAYASPGENSVQHFDVLSIVVELPIADVLAATASSGLIGVAAEVSSQPGGKVRRIERLGRPEIKNFVLSGTEHDPRFRGLEIRDLYNQEHPYAPSPTYSSVYESRFDAQLAFLDGLDGVLDWPLGSGGAHPLTPLLMADYLVLDLGKPFAPEGYFEIERALLAGRAHGTSGGRWLDDDFFDTFLTLVTTAGHRPLTDGVDKPTIAAATTFPYVMPPVLADLPPLPLP